ncbi:MAG: 4'-phosphopantetheinyl transferase superfamily protein [Bacteroidota bacterium]
MLGNDLVFSSNKKNRSEARVQRALEKILSAPEFQSLAISDLHEKMSIAWSIKEACFKYCRRFERILFYPKSFVIQQMISNEYEGEIAFLEKDLERKGFANIPHKTAIIKTPKEQLICKSIATTNYIHSIVCNDLKKFDDIYWGVSQIRSSKYIDQSTAVRNKARTHLLKATKRQIHTPCHFKKDERKIPIAYVDGVEYNVAFSFSHDHHFIAYAWCPL